MTVVPIKPTPAKGQLYSQQLAKLAVDAGWSKEEYHKAFTISLYEVACRKRGEMLEIALELAKLWNYDVATGHDKLESALESFQDLLWDN